MRNHETLVVVGNGMAAGKLIEEIRGAMPLP